MICAVPDDFLVNTHFHPAGATIKNLYDDAYIVRRGQLYNPTPNFLAPLYNIETQLMNLSTFFFLLFVIVIVIIAAELKIRINLSAVL